MKIRVKVLKENTIVVLGSKTDSWKPFKADKQKLNK